MTSNESDMEIDGTPPELRAEAQLALNNLLPAKSKERYITCYESFLKWRADKNAHSFSETVFLAYFTEMAQSKKPSSLWAMYSMMKATMQLKHNIDMQSFSNLRAWLKRNSAGYKAKKARIFSSENIETFLNCAPDDTYLAIKQLMSSTETITKGISYNFLRPWLGDGLLTSTGAKWKSHRKFLTPAFHYNILHNFLPMFLKNGNILCDTLKNLADGYSSIELFPIMAMAALDNITETIMGVSLDAQKEKDSKYVKSIDVISQICAKRMRDVFMGNELFFSLSPYKSRHDKAIDFINKLTNEVIDARRKELNSINAKKLVERSELGMKNKHAFLDLLLLAEVDGKQISDQCIRDEVLTFMFEGHDTTASGTVYGLYSIAKHPEVQRRVLEEQKDVLGGDLKRDPTFSELQQMKYLECVIKESLRIYPSVPLIQRMITKDVEMAGIRFPKNSTVVINIYRMHRNPDVFEDPLEFKPERFETSNSTQNAFSWLPFSAGPRNCIGQKFAMLELKVTLSAIVRRFELSPSGDLPEPCGDLILRSMNGVHVKMVPRH